MTEIISVSTLPPYQHYDRIHPDKLDKIFTQDEKYPGSLAELLLNNESTAVYHMDPNNMGYLRDPSDPNAIQFVKPVLLGVNYHKGHSGGDHKIVVQNIPEKKGPWVLFRPPGSNEKTFYLQNLIFPGHTQPKFEEEVANPLKILRRYLHKGNPLDIFLHFQKSGFKFVDEPMSKEYIDEIGY